MLLQVCIDLNFILPPFLWVLPRFIHFPHSASGNKTFLCMLLLSFWHSIFISPGFSQPPSFSLHPPSHWTSFLLVLFCWALGSSLQKTKLPSPLHLLTTVPMKNTVCVSLKNCTRFMKLLKMILSHYLVVYARQLYRELSRQLKFTVSISKTSDMH